MPNLDDPLNLARAKAFFPRAKDEAALVPVVFGDFLSTTHIHDDGQDGGYLPAVSIDQDNWVYLLNGLPNVPGPIQLFLNDTPQAPSVFSYVPMGDYGGIGRLIAYVQFHADPGSRAVSWNGRGARAWPADTLMTNPIDALSYMFGTYGGWTAQDTDWASIMETKRLMNVLGDTINMVFWEARTFRQWLETILQLYHTDIGLDDAGRLRFMLDTSVTNQPTTTLYHLDARRDLAGSEAEPITIRRDPADLVTEVTVSARRKWTTGDYAAKPRVSYAPGVSMHGVRHRAFEMPGMYTFAHYERWLRGIWIRYGLHPDRVTFTVRGLSLMSALPGTFLGMVSPKRGWYTPQLLKVLNYEPDEMAQTITFECFDCQRPVDVAATLPVVVMPSVRTRPIQSSPTVDLTPPGPASELTAIGSYRTIVLRFRVPPDLDYLHTEIWASQTNNRATAQNFRNGALGITPGTLAEESFDVGEGQTWFVWLMTVDREGNGANGGTGPTGGHWFPASPTAGVVATASLVDTPSLAQGAAMFEYSTSAQQIPGIYVGPVPVAQAILADLFPEGRVFAFGNVTIILPSLHTLLLEIRRTDYVIGPVVGSSPPNINPLNVAATRRFDCWGLDFDPAFPGTYYLTASVINQAGAQVAFQLGGPPTNAPPALFLLHSKR